MAGPATSPPASLDTTSEPLEEYAYEDVFISHAGQQKDAFAVHLRRELQRHGISAFLDERDINRGQRSASRMKTACIGAKLVIFVVTRDFLRSSWCLDELRWALAEREQRGGRLPEILTVLYPDKAATIKINDLNPLSRELSALLPTFHEAQPFWSQLKAPLVALTVAGAATAAGAGMPIVGGFLAAGIASMAWRKSKQQSSNSSQPSEISRVQQSKLDLERLAGLCVLRDDAYGRGDDLPMDAVVEDARRILAPYIKLLTTHLVGFEDRIKLVQRKLSLGPYNDQSGKRILAGVYGMGGVGKTSLALTIHDEAALNFSGRRIFFPVGAQCKDERELRDKRCKLLQSISAAASQPSFVSVEEERLKLRTALGGSGPLFLVLDDLWKPKQLHWLLACEDSGKLVEAVDNLPAGSRILLTSRDRRIVTVEGHEDSIIFLAELDDHFSEQLLLQEASVPSCPPATFTDEQLKLALRICAGLPLALQILGRQLRAEPQTGWQVVLESFSTEQRTMEDQLLAVLRKSYESLPSDQHRLMFLDAALMLRGRPTAHLTALWEGALLLDPPETSLLPLRIDNEVPAAWQSCRARAAIRTAKKLLEDLHGRSLIQYGINYVDTNRLMVHDWLVEMAISAGRSTHACCYTDGDQQMLGPSVTRLKCVQSGSAAAAPWSLAAHVPKHNSLQLLTARFAVFNSKSCKHGATFQLSSLLYYRALTCPASLLTMPRLRVMDLSGSKLLQQLPDGISALTDLQQLNLYGCSCLRQLCDTIVALTGLQQLNLGRCSSLQRLPDSISALTGLQQLNLFGCSSLQQLPDTLSALTELQRLNLEKCSSLQQLPDSLGALTGLRVLNISYCSSLQQMPDYITALTRLQLGGQFRRRLRFAL